MGTVSSKTLACVTNNRTFRFFWMNFSSLPSQHSHAWSKDSVRSKGERKLVRCHSCPRHSITSLLCRAAQAEQPVWFRSLHSALHSSLPGWQERRFRHHLARWSFKVPSNPEYSAILWEERGAVPSPCPPAPLRMPSRCSRCSWFPSAWCRWSEKGAPLCPVSSSPHIFACLPPRTRSFLIFLSHRRSPRWCICCLGSGSFCLGPQSQQARARVKGSRLPQ